MNTQGRPWAERVSGAVSGACIGAALVFAPLAFGGSEPWAVSVLAVLAYTALATAALRAVLERDLRPFAVALLVPLALGLCLVLVQHANWPTGLLSLAAPRTVAAYADASAVAGAALPQSIPGSLYPHGTYLALVRFSSYVALFAATCSYVRGVREIAILGAVILSVGFAAGLIGMLQSVSGAGRIYWLRTAPHGGLFGPFVGRNQYAAYATVCTFVGIGLLLLRSERWFEAGQTCREWLPANGPLVVLLVFAIGVIGASVPWSLSRAGTLSMLLGFGGVLGAAGLVQRRKRYWALIGTCFVAVLSVITCLGWGRVVERLLTLKEIAVDPSAQWRWQMFGDALRMGRDFPALGVGAGGFSSVYPVYRTIPTSSLVESPHNEYLHVFAEAGVPGALLLLAGLVLAFVVVLRGLRAGRHSYTSGFMVAGLGAMLSVSVHSTADYPMRSPAIAATVAVLVAMLCRLAAMHGVSTAPVRQVAARAGEGGPIRPDLRPNALPASMPGRRMAAPGALLGVAVVAVAWGSGVTWASGPVRADLAGLGVPTSAASATRSSDPLATLRQAHRALAQDRAAALSEPLNAGHVVAIAEDCLRSGRPDLAWSCAVRACELARDDVSLSAHLAEEFAHFGYPAAARGYLAEAERLARLAHTPEAAELVKAARAWLARPAASRTRV